MDSKAKYVSALAILLATAFFLSTVYNNPRSESLAKLSDDAWVKQRLADRFPGFPVTSFLGEVTDTQKKLKEPILPNTAQIVELVSGKHPEYFRWFTVSQREGSSTSWDPSNHYHLGFITSDLEIYDLGLDEGIQ